MPENITKVLIKPNEVGGEASLPHINNNSPQECNGPNIVPSYLEKKEYVNIRYIHKMPHWFQEGKTQFVTFRLADSLPQTKLAELSAIKETWLKEHPEPWNEQIRTEYNNLIREKVDKWLDAGYGCCALKRPDLRAIVTKAFSFFEGDRYALHALVVMPNHVHVLLTPIGDNDVIKSIGSIKSFTASQINKLLKTNGRFWQRDCFDRIIRSADDFQAKLNYIIHNPDTLPPDTFTLYTENEARR